MRRISVKPGLPLGIRKALWEQPCGFCHWSLSLATWQSQKASWVRKLAEILVPFWSLSEDDGLWTLKAELSFPLLHLEDWSVYDDVWESEKGFGWKAELLGYTGMGWAVGGGRPFPSLLPSHKQLPWSRGGDPLEEMVSAVVFSSPWGCRCSLPLGLHLYLKTDATNISLATHSGWRGKRRDRIAVEIFILRVLQKWARCWENVA